MQDNLHSLLESQMRDIHLPDPISWWPLAIGWWFIIAAGLFSIIWGSHYLVKRYRQNQYRKTALNELKTEFDSWKKSNDTSHYLLSANAILKRIIRHVSDNPKDVSLSGNAWHKLLNRYSKTVLSDNAVHALTEACYQADPDVDIDELNDHLITWIKSHLIRPAIAKPLGEENA